MKIKKFYENNNINEISLIDEENEEISVCEDTIRDLLSFVGEGVDDITESNVNSEIHVTFFENANGNISLNEWNKLNDVLEKLRGHNGFQDFDIICSRNKVELMFDDDFTAALYSKNEFEKLKIKNDTKKYNL